MDSRLFGSGVPKFAVGITEVNIENSFIESIELESRDIEHESIINTVRNWTKKVDHDHITVTVLCRLHKKTTTALVWWKNFYDNYNKTEVDSLFPSQNSDAFSDTTGTPVKFWLQITELFPLETPWAYDTFRMIFKSKKPVKLSAVTVTTDDAVITDTSGEAISDTSGEILTD